MRYFVTGGVGFIGKAFCDSARQSGHEVMVWDKLHQQDLANTQLLTETIKRYQPDWVIHLAATPGVSSDMDVGIKDIDNTANLLRAMGDCKKILFASTGSVYGHQRVHPTVEHAMMEPQVSFYATAKLACEGLLAVWAAREKATAVVLRLGTVIGPGNKKGFIADFVRKLTADPTKLQPLGDGNQAKSYIHIDDLVSAMFVAMEDANGFWEYNVGTGGSATIKECLPWICDELEVTPAVTFGASASGFFGDIPKIELDVQRLRSKGWSPKWTIEDAVRQNVISLVTSNAVAA